MPIYLLRACNGVFAIKAYTSLSTALVNLQAPANAWRVVSACGLELSASFSTVIPLIEKSLTDPGRGASIYRVQSALKVDILHQCASFLIFLCRKIKLNIYVKRCEII